MNIEAQCCGLIILLLIMFFFLFQKKLGLYSEHMFAVALAISFIELLLDIASAWTIVNADRFSDAFVHTMCKAYIVSLVWIAWTALIYVLMDVFSERWVRMLSFGLFFLTFAESVLIFWLPIDYYYDGYVLYSYGPSTIATYIFALLYVVITFTSLIVLGKRILMRRRVAAILWMGVWIIAAAIQFMNPQLLVVGFASAIGVMILFLTLENPESNIDRHFGCFHAQAMMSYLTQCYYHKKSVSIIILSMSTAKNNICDDQEIENSIYTLVQYLEKFRKIKVFKNLDQDLVIICEDMSQMTVVYQDIQDKFYQDQFYRSVKQPQKSFPITFFLLIPKSIIVESASEMLRLYQMLKLEYENMERSLVCYLNDRTLHELREKDDIKAEIISALEEDRVEVFYQPIYSTREKAFVSAEALVRIRNHNGEIVPPGVFIPIAEETGLIGPLGERVFEKTCEFIHASNLVALGIHYIEVNLSVVQCQQRNLAEQYIGIMKKYQISPGAINLEITETGSVSTKQILLENMRTLIDYGVSFSLDDFGNGQSNLDYVISMPVSIMKFDMSMTQAYFKDLKAQFVMRAAVAMAHDMDIFLVAEGVEEENQLTEMAKEGIDYIQGYFFSKPLPQNEFVSFLETHLSNKSSLASY